MLEGDQTRSRDNFSTEMSTCALVVFLSIHYAQMRENLIPRRYKHRLDFGDLKKSVSSQH